MINDYDKGGLKLIDIQSFNKSLKMKWVQGYLNDDNHGKWKLFLDFHLQRCGGKLVFLSNLKPQDIRDLLNQDQTFLSYNAFVAKYNIKTNYLEYFKVIAALRQFKKVCPPALVNPSTNDTVSLLSHPNINEESYRRLVQDKASTPLQSQEKWLAEKDIVGNSTVNWRNAYYLPFLCTRETKLRVFQFKFLHR